MQMLERLRVLRSSEFAPKTMYFVSRWFKIAIVITFYSTSCREQETAVDPTICESSCHLPTYLPHTVKASHCPFNAEHAEKQ